MMGKYEGDVELIDPNPPAWVAKQRRRLLANVRRAEPGLAYLVCMSFFTDFLCSQILDKAAGGPAVEVGRQVCEAVARVFRPYLGDEGQEKEESLVDLGLQAVTLAEAVEQFNSDHGPHTSLWFEQNDPVTWLDDGFKVRVLHYPEYEGEALPVVPALRWLVGGEVGLETPGWVAPVPGVSWKGGQGSQ